MEKEIKVRCEEKVTLEQVKLAVRIHLAKKKLKKPGKRVDTKVFLRAGILFLLYPVFCYFMCAPDMPVIVRYSWIPVLIIGILCLGYEIWFNHTMKKLYAEYEKACNSADYITFDDEGIHTDSCMEGGKKDFPWEEYDCFFVTDEVMVFSFKERHIIPFAYSKVLRTELEHALKQFDKEDTIYWRDIK